MFKKIFIITFFIIGCLSANINVDSNKLLMKTMSLIDINKVFVHCPLDINIHKSDDEKLLLQADKNTIKNIDVIFKNNSLNIECNKSFNTKNVIVVDLFVRKIKKVDLKGSINLFLDNIEEEDFSLFIEGSITVTSNLSKIKNFFLNTNGSFVINLKNLATAKSKLNLFGTGDIYLSVEKYLFVKSEAVSNIYFKGNPIIKKDLNFMTILEEVN